MWLGDQEETGEPLFPRKELERLPTGAIRVWRENPPVRFRSLRDDDWLDTGDLMRLFRCTQRTVYRYVERGLKPTRKIGRDLFWRKRDVVRWCRDVQRFLKEVGAREVS
jgi:hypothetical protein